MMKERSSVGPPEDSQEKTIAERREILAEVIQFQLDYNSQHPRMAEGPLVHDNKLWYFRASNRIATTHMEPNWFHYKLIPPSQYIPMLHLTEVSQEARARFSEYFSVDMTSQEELVAPEFDEYGEDIEASLQLAFEKRKMLRNSNNAMMK